MAPSRPDTPLFAQHSRQWERNRYVYPVISRRSKGLSIGVNLNTDRICNFDCVYCCVDRSKGVGKPEAVDLSVLGRELSELVALAQSGKIWEFAPLSKTPAELRRFADIAFSGNGEPTAAGEFARACRLVAEVRAEHHADAARIVLITNGTLLDRAEVREALAYLDQHNGEVWAKLDAGNERVYAQMVRTTIPLDRVLKNIAMAGRERALVIQSMFLRMNGQNPQEQDVRDYLDRLHELVRGGCRLKAVQVYTIARPVFRTHIAPAGPEVLDAVAAAIGELGIPAEAYYATSSRS